MYTLPFSKTHIHNATTISSSTPPLSSPPPPLVFFHNNALPRPNRTSSFTRHSSRLKKKFNQDIEFSTGSSKNQPALFRQLFKISTIESWMNHIPRLFHRASRVNVRRRSRSSSCKQARKGSPKPSRYRGKN